MTNLFNKILGEERIPNQWRASTIIPLFKGKGDPQECGNYRETKEKVFEEAEKWSKRLAGYGLKVNNRKTVYMEMNVTGTPSLDDQLMYPKVDRFTYLGSMLQQEGGCAKEFNARIQKGWLKWRSISGVMCDKKMPI
ncbi:uncharacterized protein LOC135924252 [Gordionus sp. m RMFG-2023]|uniref:uncharacterized protein LOC135924252 n=1 Tax=Gordionus sp. m RMFG-2023 TaxID=3053472 RepID=UPI0031FD266A